jgi:O-antigen/teichoic acid export membrane protein
MVETVQQREAVTSEIRTAARHSAVYGLGAMAAKAVGFLMLPVYTHYLTPVDYGVLEILDLSMSLLGMFLNMGMTAALLRYYGIAKSTEEKNQVVSTSLIFVTVTGLVMLLLALGFVRPISMFVFGPAVSSTYLLLSFFSFILGYIANLPRAYLRALESSGTFILLDTLGVLATLVMNIVFVAGLKIGIAGILWSALLVNVAWIAASGWVFRRVGLGFSRSLLRQMVGFGLPLILANLALFALNFSDRFFLKHFRSLDTVGIYSVGYKFGYMMNFLMVQPFLGMWQARMYIIHARSDHPQIYGRIFVLYSLLLIYSGLALSILSPEIVRVMVSPKFAASQDVIPLVVLAYIFYGIGSFAQLGMFLTERTKSLGTISAAAAILNLGLNYFLIRQFGMIGAAWATMLSFLAIAAASYWYSQRLLPLPLGTLRLTVALGFAIALFLVSRLLPLESLGASIPFKALLLTAFPIALWKGRVLTPPEIATVVSMANSCRAKALGLLAWAQPKAAGL